MHGVYFEMFMEVLSKNTLEINFLLRYKTKLKEIMAVILLLFYSGIIKIMKSQGLHII